MVYGVKYVVCYHRVCLLWLLCGHFMWSNVSKFFFNSTAFQGGVLLQEKAVLAWLVACKSCKGKKKKGVAASEGSRTKSRKEDQILATQQPP